LRLVARETRPRCHGVEAERKPQAIIAAVKVRAEPHQEILARTAATNDPRTVSGGFSDDLPYEENSKGK
jgi:hypothetical protein